MDEMPVVPEMTLRDYFAARVLVHALRNGNVDMFGTPDYRQVAHRAYMMADAMMAEKGECI